MTTEKDALNDDVVAEESTENVDDYRLVSVEGGKMFTTSLMVAETFGKNHKDVLKAIDNLECSKEFHKRNFAPMVYTAEIGSGAKREFPAYTLTRDGFSYLAMGFTGAKAAVWKEKFLEAFNAMEQELLNSRFAEYSSQIEQIRKPEITAPQYTRRKPCTQKQLSGLEGLVDFWCHVEGIAKEEAMRTLYSAMHITELKQLQQFDLDNAFHFVWRAVFRIRSLSGSPAAEEKLRPVLGLMAAWECSAQTKRDIYNYISTACNIDTMKNIDEKNIPKLLFAVFLGYLQNHYKNIYNAQ